MKCVCSCCWNKKPRDLKHVKINLIQKYSFTTLSCTELQFFSSHHDGRHRCVSSILAVLKVEPPGGVLVSQLQQEAQHQVAQQGAQRLVVVAHDVRPVLLQLDQRVLRLQVQNVSVCRLLHLHLSDAVLRSRDTSTEISNLPRCKKCKTEANIYKGGVIYFFVDSIL